MHCSETVYRTESELSGDELGVGTKLGSYCFIIKLHFYQFFFFINTLKGVCQVFFVLFFWSFVIACERYTVKDLKNKMM